MSLLTRFLYPIFPHAALRHCIITNIVAQHKQSFPFLYICTGVPSSGKSTFATFAKTLIPSLVIVQHGSEEWMQTVLTSKTPILLFVAQESLEIFYHTFTFPLDVHIMTQLFVFESTFTENPVKATEFFHDIHMKKNISQVVEEFLETYSSESLDI